jgi:thiol:disulfide interchange protein/DsbC/DsbD-like thiol-disulfide interchange protein
MNRLLLAGALALPAFASLGAPLDVPHARVELVAAQDSIRAGQPLLVALRIEHEAGWHTYWKNPGDSGMPTRIAWTLPQGFAAGPILWPVPERIPVGPLTNIGYHGETLLLTEIATPKTLAPDVPSRIEAKAEWLICKEVCLPGGATLSLELPAGAGKADARWALKLRDARAAVPQPLQGWKVTAQPSADHIVLHLAPQDGAQRLPGNLVFHPDDAEIVDYPSPQSLVREDTGSYRLELTAAPAFKGNIAALSGLLVADTGSSLDGMSRAATISAAWPGGAPTARASPPTAAIDAEQITTAARGTDADRLGLVLALTFAFLGGLVLNLMPCVFPVVSIKVLGFVEQAHGSAQRLRAHGLAFAAGIVVCFWIVAGSLIALRASGQALGWGYQLQSPPIVAGLATLFFVLGLNLSGVFEWGLKLQTAAGNVSERGGLRGAFFAGLLATVVAAPCTAPFMGAALGYALTQPVLQSMVVFTALALGMAAPYVALSFQPKLVRWLPRPGRWMETFKQVLAFPLYLTAVWLVWVLGEQLGIGAAARLLAALVLVAAALWAWNRFLTPAHGSRRAVALVAVVALLVTAALFGWPAGEPRAATADASGSWTPYSDAALQAERASGRAVFVDFTAAWCVTCQVNKRLVLDSPVVQRAFADHGVVRMRADWTNRDALITAALARLGRNGVPVYAVYSTTRDGAPELLPELLTSDIVVRALERAAAGRS